ncbi:MAG: hypothetical protein QOG05_2002 [Streptosporangiaceae bacterium]|nr:hypothetical protein [Streptosporangiaceae bacterium]
MISGKRSHSQRTRHMGRLALPQSATWPWRFASLLMLALLATILLPRPEMALAVAGGPKAPAKPALNVVVIGDFYSYGYAGSTDPALQRSTPPTLQALNQIQAANPGVQVNVLFIPVSEATSASLFQATRLSTSSARPALINAVRHASVVIVGVGANNARLAASMRAALFGSISANAFSRLMAAFDNGSVLRAQTALLQNIAANAAPGTSIVTLGYPTVLGEQLPSGFTWWSPFTWTAISQQQANMSGQLVSALNTANDQATRIAAAQHSGLHFLYADLSGAMQGAGPISPPHSRHAAAKTSTGGSQSSSLKQTIIGSALVPYVDQAANNELAVKGVRGSQNIPPVTPTSRWNLSVVLPLAGPQPHPGSNSAVSAPPNGQYNPSRQDNPVYQRPSSPGFPAGPPLVGGLTPSQTQTPGEGGPSISLPLPSIPLIPSADTGTRGDRGQRSGQPGDTGQPSTKPTGSGQPKPQPTDQPSTQPTGSGAPTPQPSASAGQPTDQPSTQPTASGQPTPQPSASIGQPASRGPSPDSTLPATGLPPGTTPLSCPPLAQAMGAGQSSLISLCPGPSCALMCLPQTPPVTPTLVPPTTHVAPVASAIFGGGAAPAPANVPPPSSVHTPMIPAPPAPLPKPIAPQEPPGVATSPGSATNPGAGTSSTPAPPAAPAVPVTQAPPPPTAPAVLAAAAPPAAQAPPAAPAVPVTHVLPAPPSPPTSATTTAAAGATPPAAATSPAAFTASTAATTTSAAAVPGVASSGSSASTTSYGGGA